MKFGLGFGALLARFQAQFVADCDGYLFRRRSTGAAIAVSAAERDGFVADYARFGQRLFSRSVWLMTGGMLAIVIAKTAAPQTFTAPLFYGLLFAVLALGMISLMSLKLRGSFDAPTTALAGRKPVAPPFDAARTRLVRAKMTPGWAFVYAPLSVIFLWFKFGPNSDYFSGWNLVWVIGTAAYLGLFVYTGVNKWRAGHANAEPI